MTLSDELNRRATVSADTASGFAVVWIPRGAWSQDTRAFAAYFLDSVVGSSDQVDDLLANVTEVHATDGEGATYPGAPVVAHEYTLRSASPFLLERLAKELDLTPAEPRRALADVSAGDWTFWMPERVRSVGLQTPDGILFIAARPGGRVVAGLGPMNETATPSELLGARLREFGLPTPGVMNVTWQSGC